MPSLTWLKFKRLSIPWIVKNVEKKEHITYWGKDWRMEQRAGQRMRCLGGITDSMGMSLSKLWKIVEEVEDGCATVHKIAKSQIQLISWTTPHNAVGYFQLYYQNSARATGLEGSAFVPIPKKDNAKECSNYYTTALISHTHLYTLVK